MTPSWSRRMRHGAEYALVSVVAALVRPLPMSTVRSVGEVFGRLVYRLAGSRRRIALDNIARAMPELSAADRARIVRGVFEHFARMTLELIRFGRLTREEMLALIEIEGEEHVQRAYASGRGLIFFSAHFGYWEMQGLVNPLCWRPISVLARPLDNTRLHEMLERIRTLTGNTVIYRQGAVRKVLRALAANSGVAILIDQHLQSPDAVLVEFFGRAAATSSMVAALAARTGAAVLPAFGGPLPGGRYRFVYEPPIDPPADDSPESLRDFTQRCSDRIEAHVRSHPDLWLWMHRRWRTAGDTARVDRPAVSLLDEEPHV